MANNIQDQMLVELVGLIQQFLSHQIETNVNLNDATKESLTVATECIEQAYNIHRKPASDKLLQIFKTHKQQSPSSAGSGAQNDPAQLISNIASTLFSQLGSVASANSGATSAGSNSGEAQQTATTAPTPNNREPSAPPKQRKRATDAEKLAAESFKNQGNDHMKSEEFRQAYECYTRAIEIDDNNAIYYSNRAAAYSKLGDHQSALGDCKEAIEIDPTYSKAYGRMGLAYASMDNHLEAKKAYLKAVELDPTNESYQNNLNIAEERLREQQGGGQQAQSTGANVAGMLRSMMSNPQVMSMAMQSLQDPRIQGMLGLNQNSSGTNQSNPAEQQQASSGQNPQQQDATNAQTNQQAQPPRSTDRPANEGQPAAGFNPMDLLNMTRMSGGNPSIDLVNAGQHLMSSLQQNNPDLVENMRRMMSQAFMNQGGGGGGGGGGGNSNENDRNPPPGYS